MEEKDIVFKNYCVTITFTDEKGIAVTLNEGMSLKGFEDFVKKGGLYKIIDELGLQLAIAKGMVKD